MMNELFYSRQAFEAAQQQTSEQMQAVLNADPGYQSAMQTLQKAQADLEHIQTFAKNQPTLERRLQFNLNITQAKEAVAAAEKAALAARNQVYRQAYLSRLEEQRAEREKAQAEQQQKRAKEQEAEAKAQYRIQYLAAGGTAEQFEKAWSGPDGLWQKELQARATEQLAGAKQHMSRRYQF